MKENMLAQSIKDPKLLDDLSVISFIKATNSERLVHNQLLEYRELAEGLLPFKTVKTKEVYDALLTYKDYLDVVKKYDLFTIDEIAPNY